MKNILKISLLALFLSVFLLIGVFTRNYLLDVGVLFLKEKQYDRAFKYLKLVAIAGDSDAQSHLAECFAFGHGVSKDFEEALYWFKRASNKHNCNGDQCIAAELYFVGEKYLEGIGVESNHEEALVWIKMAAKNGYPKAVKYIAAVQNRTELEIKN